MTTINDNNPLIPNGIYKWFLIESISVWFSMTLELLLVMNGLANKGAAVEPNA